MILYKNSIEIFFQISDQAHHDKLLEICFGSWFLISDDSGSLWAMKSSASDSWKKVQSFPLEDKKLTHLYFVQKLTQIVQYGWSVIGIV